MVKSFLIVQTAFIGDAILASSLIEKLHQFYPEAQIDILIRKGNEGLFKNHPFLHKALIWDKKHDKIKNLLRLIGKVRRHRYDYVINLQRYFSTGLLTGLSGASHRRGFSSNPLSFLFSKSATHSMQHGQHEVERNQVLIEDITDEKPALPKLYPSSTDFDVIKQYKNDGPYYCMAPTSVWFTKQFPKEKWVELIQKLPTDKAIYLLGGPGDKELVEEIILSAGVDNVYNLSGTLSFLASAALMKDALMNYVNDSAPQHLASAMNAPVTAIFCSTIPSFGFGPLSEVQHIWETPKALACRPCGLHGRRSCPLGHFDCGYSIPIEVV